MSKLKKFSKLLLIVSLILCGMIGILFMGGAALADGSETPPVGEITDNSDNSDDTEENGLQDLIDSFLVQLKEKYGDDYERYYNAILEEWGSVEAYLLSLAENGTIPDVAADGWTKFVIWLGEYAPIWGSILAVTALIIVIMFGKKALKKVTGFVTNTGSKFKTLFAELNKMENVQIAQNRALEKLLGENQRYAEQRQDLEKTVEEIKDDGEV